MCIYRILLAATLLTMIPGTSGAELTRDYMTIVGSATVYPFSERVIEHFVKRSGFRTPRVQTTGSGGGLMLFCMGTGVLEPDITYASRRITKKEFNTCRKNGVGEIVEIKIGDDGYLSDVGLVPLPEAERRKYARDAKNLTPMSM